MLKCIGECNHFAKTAIHWCVLLFSQVSFRQWHTLPTPSTKLEAVGRCCGDPTCTRTQQCFFWDRGNCWAFSPWNRGRQPCHHFTDSLTPPCHLPCHHFPKSHLLLWASRACAHTQQRQARPKLKLNLCGVLAQFPFNQTSSQTLFQGWEQLRHKGTEMTRVISTCKCPSCKPAPPQQPQPVLAGKYPTRAGTQDISDHPHCQKQTFTQNPREGMNTQSQKCWCWKQSPSPSQAQGLPIPSVGAWRKVMAQPEHSLLQGKLVIQQLKLPLCIL